MIELDKSPKNPIIIEGFPGFGFVSTIVTEFLIKHLNAKRIGDLSSTKLAPMIAIHNSELVDPLEVYYDSKHNIIILRALSSVAGAEWEIANMIAETARKLKAKEIIGVEGVASENIGKESKVYYYTNLKNGKFDKIKINNFKNGIIVGVTGALLLSAKDLPLSCIFVDANPAIPDSRAAGEIVKILDDYLNLKIDYKPLIKAAEDFEGKLKQLLSGVKKTNEQMQQKEASYLG